MFYILDLSFLLLSAIEFLRNSAIQVKFIIIIIININAARLSSNPCHRTLQSVLELEKRTPVIIYAEAAQMIALLYWGLICVKDNQYRFL